MIFHAAAVRANLAVLASILVCACAAPRTRVSPRVDLRQAGAVAGGATLNTTLIQNLIDRLATGGGGTVVVPAGVFVSGALFFKPGVHLHLERSAVLLSLIHI
jgi:polygalacturonase